MVNYLLPDSFEIEVLLEKINHVFSAIPESIFQKHFQYYDTFDWRLYQNGLTLYQQGNSLCLEKLTDQTPLTELTLTSKTVPSFWWDLPESALRETLRSTIKIRALTSLFECSKNTKKYRLLNADKKTVLWLTISNVGIREKSGGTTLRFMAITPLRGYGGELNKIHSLYNVSELQQVSQNQMDIFLNVLGRVPRTYSSKFDVKLNPQMNSLEAARMIFQHLLKAIRENEEGVKADIDTEFLHDFRVAIRRTRAALTQIKGVLPNDIIERFKNDFAYIGRSTNVMRDLDVYLLKENIYISMLPKVLQPGLNDLFTRLKRQRKAELKKMLKVLNGERYRTILILWRELIEDDEKQFPETESGSKPVLELSKALIAKRYRKVLNEGTKITPETPDNDVHQLRINCKKLRYLIEFFTSLFPTQKINDLVKQLKVLQNNLGDFNDFSVQQNKMNDYFEDFKNRESVKADTLAAMGGLITLLRNKKDHARKGFDNAFSKFASVENQQLFDQLFEMEKPN